MWVTLGTAPDGDGELLLRLEGIAQYVGRLQRTLVAEGIDGISGALQMARHVEEALAGVPADEVVRLRTQLHACETRLHELARCVEQVRELKGVVGGD